MAGSDAVVVGASFAGLACATALARRGVHVTVLERKRDVGAKLHTTGIVVREAAESSTLLAGVPPELVRRIGGVRLYAPSLRHIDLAAPDYYFLATDTPRLMRWLAARAQEDGVRLACGMAFRGARRVATGFDLGWHGTTRYLVGADGPHSTVARALGLGRNREFLFGIEHEYAGVQPERPGLLHCFIDRDLAPGYLGWIVAGPAVTQVGLAYRVGRQRRPARAALAAFIDKIAPVLDVRRRTPVAVRAGAIPCGGLVAPLAQPGALLVGDAAGMVSPVTAGGIHTALRHGAAAGTAIADWLQGRGPDPARDLVARYPRFRAKRALRFLFDRLQNDRAFELLLGTSLLRRAAATVYFHRRQAFEPAPEPGAGRAGAPSEAGRGARP